MRLSAGRHPHRVRGLVIADSLAGIEAPEPLASALKATAKANRNLSQVERVLGGSFRERNPAETLLYLQLASFIFGQCIDSAWRDGNVVTA